MFQAITEQNTTKNETTKFYRPFFLAAVMCMGSTNN